MSEDVVFEVDVEGACAEVYALLADPVRVREWLPMTVFEPWVGGRVELEARGLVAEGVVLRMEPTNVLSYSWDWRDVPLPDPSVVTVSLRATPNGTRVSLRHSGLPSPEREGFAEGWGYYLPRLQQAVSGVVAPRDVFAAGEG